VSVARQQELPGLAAAALRELAESALDAGHVDEGVATLRQLAKLEPGSHFGARALWQRGWQQFEARNDAGAVGNWSELWDLYPDSAYGRSARYWSARAHERLGHATHALEIYRELAGADTADFYARQAAERLAGRTALSALAARAERDPWPEHPVLARAARLTDYGLDSLAATELELVGDAAPEGARAALEAVVEARRGDRRTSLRMLRVAFPALGTANQAAVPERALALFYPLDFRTAVETQARRQRLDPALVFGMIHQESGFDASARSRSGARGLMQLMPGTGKEVAQKLGLGFSTTRLNDPEYSVRLGTTYFRQVLDRFGGRVELALAGYNGGPGRISRLWNAAGPQPELDRFLEGLSVSESRIYVKRILVLADSYRSLYPDLG
ncbi:MAG: lytic transglycosylase domain-containing protein, partial [Acidobacteria bacterium]|nr:lytic transglycosylase domain-containing protein [Acidobacteriota bacterium]